MLEDDTGDYSRLHVKLFHDDLADENSMKKQKETNRQTSKNLVLSNELIKVELDRKASTYFSRSSLAKQNRSCSREFNPM